ADNEVVRRIKTVPNVYSVVPFGGYRRQLQVIVDRQKLAAYGLSILDVKSAIDRNNVSRPAGNLTTNDREAIVRVDTRALGAQDILNYPLASVGGGAIQTVAAPAASGGMNAMGGGETSAAPAVSQGPRPKTQDRK